MTRRRGNEMQMSPGNFHVTATGVCVFLAGSLGVVGGVKYHTQSCTQSRGES